MGYKIKLLYERLKKWFKVTFTYKDFKRIKKKDYDKKTNYLKQRKYDLCDFVLQEGNGVISKNNKRYLFFKFYIRDTQNKGISDELIEKERHCLTEFCDDMQLEYRIYGIKEKESNLHSNLEYYEMLLHKGGWSEFQEEVLRESIDKIKFHNDCVKCVMIMMIEDKSKNILINYEGQIEFELVCGNALIELLRKLNNEWWC